MTQTLKVQSFEQAQAMMDKAHAYEMKRLVRKTLLPVAKSISTEGTAIINDDLSLQAWLFLNSPYKYHWYCAGIGTGKSYILSRYVLKRVMENYQTVGLLAANTYTQLAQSTLPHLFELLDATGLEYVINSRPPKSWKASAKFRGGYKNIISIKVGVGKVAHILTRTLANWKKIRGVTIGWAGIDEIADTIIDAWNEIKERLRCKKSHRRQIMVVGMPALPGNNWTWQVFNPKDPEAAKLFKVTFQSSTEAQHLDYEDYILPQLRTLDPMRALQRIYARIVIDQTGKLYYAYADQVNNVPKYEYDPLKTIFMCWDFNIMSVAPICAVLFQEHWNKQHECWDVMVFDEIVIPNATTVDACYEFLKRYGEVHQAGVWIFGDATSNLNRTTTEFSHIRKHLRPHFKDRLKVVQLEKKSNPRVEYRVASVNAMLFNTRGKHGKPHPRMFIHPEKCPETILDLLEVKPKDAGGIEKGDNSRTHCTDGLGYGLAVRHPPFKKEKARAVRGNM